MREIKVTALSRSTKDKATRNRLAHNPPEDLSWRFVASQKNGAKNRRADANQASTVRNEAAWTIG
jgi:hypothetical protein